MTPNAHPPAAAGSDAAALELQHAKALVWQMLLELPGPGGAEACHRWLAPDVQWVAGHPVPELTGPQAVAESWVAPLCRALPDLERRVDLLFGGHWDGHIDGGAGCWVTATGHLVGHFREPLFGIPAHGEPVWLRYGEFHRVVGGHVAESRVLLDLPDLARQAGRPVLPAATGRETVVPGPRHGQGVRLGPSDPAETQASFDLVMAMIGGLGRFDGGNLASMGMARFWHPDMMWYGPGGIGTSRSIAGFEQHHQKPFLIALPDRKGGHHRARFADGPFVASTGWPSVRATQLGPYLGHPPTGQRIGLRVMDWWRAEAGLLHENWVLLDLPDLFRQFGVDLLGRATA
jgi:predicted ester cyclase